MRRLLNAMSRSLSRLLVQRHRGAVWCGITLSLSPGGKASNWEGGVRVNAWVSGGALPEAVRGTKKEGLTTIWDWWATFAAIGGIDDIEVCAVVPCSSLTPPSMWIPPPPTTTAPLTPRRHHQHHSPRATTTTTTTTTIIIIIID
jgi:hypothetical protein